ncbi:murein hydrolase activator EnvC family protein [Fibrobacterota bacterium]
MTNDTPIINILLVRPKPFRGGGLSCLKKKKRFNRIYIVRFCRMVTLFILCASITIQSATRNLEQDIKKQKSELKALKNTLAEEKRKLNNLIRQKTDVLGQMEKTSEHIALIEKYMQKLDATSNTLRLTHKENKKELINVQDRILQRNSLIASHVRSLFIAGKEDVLRFNQIPWNEKAFFKRIFFVKRMVAYEKSLVASAQKDEREKRKIIKSVNKKLQEMQAFKKHKLEEKQTFSKEQKELKTSMSRLQNDENIKRRALKQMEKNARALSKIIKALEEQRKAELARDKKGRTLDKKGRFCAPVRGRLVSRFGLQYHSTLKTSTKNLGVEYLGVPGESVLSAASGEVVYVDEIPGYGRGIIIYNGSGYYTIYGNLSSISVKVGDKITGCREIAVVPSQGGKLQRKIYFEVRKERNPLNPVNWLKQ